MFTQRFLTSFKKPFGFAQGKDKRVKVRRSDDVADQVRKMLQETDQKLILMVRS